MFISGPASGLSNLRVSVPSIVLRGDTTSFNCSWDMEPVDKVWAVKWYRGNFEIFRFIADEQPPTKIFKLDNFDVDVSTNLFWLKALITTNIYKELHREF